MCTPLVFRAPHVAPVRVARIACAVTTLVALAAARPARVAAQGTPTRGVLEGSVRASDASRLSGARVELLPDTTRRSADRAGAITGRDGVFRLDDVPAGRVGIVVRRLGFRPETLTVRVPQGNPDSVVVTLKPVAQPLAPVLVTERTTAGPLPSAFERRRTSGFGHYITRADIERQKPQRTTDLLRSIPGVTLNGIDGSHSLRFRSTGGSSCEPSFYMNGAPVSGALDLDAMNPQMIESLEVYSGAATVPAALRSAIAPGGCGAVAIWSRMGDSAPVEDDADGSAADSLALRVAQGWAYTADQVELPANPLPGMGAAPAYPDNLRKAGIGGRVLVEFIVDEQGKVDPESVNIVSSTHPLLSAAVRSAVVHARFAPAYTKGHVVRQVVQQPVVFDPKGAERR